MDLDREGCRDLVLAVFRLAVCDYLGQRYGHDGPVAPSALQSPSRARRVRAEDFLKGAWADEIADMSGFSAAKVWREVAMGLDRPHMPRR
ncbi:MAG: hypothetical protein ACR2MY_11075 [Candidatus Dormibacteria bacterium]